MRKINKRLLVSDFDDTLLTSDQKVPDEVRKAIEEYVAAGGIFAVCTGRMLNSILPRVREMGLKGLVVAYQGTVIGEIESGKIIKKNFINSVEVVKVCKFIENLNFGINVYSDETLYTSLPKDDKKLVIYEKITGIDAVGVNIPLSEFVTKNSLNCQKISCLVSPEERESLYKILLENFGDKFDVTCSAEVLVEISPYGDNKGEALRYIANYYGVPLSSTVAIGDNLNDLSMIQAADVGVAVGNAVKGLKDAADVVTVTNNECGVAKIIKKYGFM